MKSLYKFAQCDIKEFYPSIKEPLLVKALKLAEEYIDIPTDNKAIIKHARKSLLFNKRETWMKKDSGLFDVAMGAFDGAEACKLVAICYSKYYLKNEKERILLHNLMMD